jgi:hypothetical protein
VPTAVAITLASRRHRAGGHEHTSTVMLVTVATIETVP